MLVFLQVPFVFAQDDHCALKLVGYKLVENSVFPFTIENEKACFFAYYTTNPNPMTDARGDGNLGDSIWYGYYKIKDIKKIYDFPKPSDTLWGHVCSINAISFYPMHGGTKRDVTIIGSCDKYNAMNHTYPFVFVWQKDRFVLDKTLRIALHGFVGLSVDDVRKYIRSPVAYYLKKRNEWR